MSETLFTDAHGAAIKSACDTLGKIFDGYLIVAMTTDDTMKREQATYRYGGGRILAKGLATEFLSRVSHEDHGPQPPEDGN